jgi:hypothetical protein
MQTIGHEKFLEDLARSAPQEVRIANLVIRKSLRSAQVCFLPESASYKQKKEKDFVVTFDGDKKVVFEHKADFKATDTWNLAIEYLCNGRRSGLASTNAHIWISSVMEPNTGVWRDYMGRVDKLREIFFSDKFPLLCEPNLQTKGVYWHQFDSNRTSGDSSTAWFLKLCIDLHVEGKSCWTRLDLLDDASVDWLAMAV